MKPALSSGSFGPVLHAFFLERLVAQRNASPRTVAAYRDSFRLLLQFAQQQLQKAPEALDLQDLDAPLVLAFLDHVERTRTTPFEPQCAVRGDSILRAFCRVAGATALPTSSVSSRFR
jgi:site-specific recombinase XerD